MRVVLLVAALFAVCAVVDVSARRIHKMKAALVAADAEEVDVEAMPFDGDYWASAAKPQISKAVAAEAKKPQLDTAAILKQYFSAENIQLGQQQQGTVVATIGTYTATAMTKQCNEGTCDDKWKDFEMTGQWYAGGAGNLVLTCSVQDLAAAKCDLNVVFGGNSLMNCPNIGAAKKTCSVPKPTRYGSGAGAWMSNDFLIKADAPNSAVSEVYFTKAGLTVNNKFFGLDYAKKLTFSAFVLQSADLSGYKPAAQPAMPAPAAELVAASKGKKLTTSQILGKFFTSDNIQLAQMQGSTVPVRATIGAFTASAVTRTCNTGTCEAPKPFEMTGQWYAGGEGSIVLTCSVPADLSQAKCDLNFVFGGNSLMNCPNVGAADAKCSNPKPTRYGSGAGAWMSNDFLATTVEAAEVYFTNDLLAVHFRFRGLDYAKKLVFSDFTLLSTPLTEFGVPPKTNCLSKTTADAVMAAAAAKKGLKNAIALQAGPVAELIKSAPYKTVEDAVAKIKGIGPRNVVYVSFMWNFQC